MMLSIKPLVFVAVGFTLLGPFDAKPFIYSKYNSGDNDDNNDSLIHKVTTQKGFGKGLVALFGGYDSNRLDNYSLVMLRKSRATLRNLIWNVEQLFFLRK